MFDPTKPVQTRDGSAARIICTDLKSAEGYSIVALVMGNSAEMLQRYRSNGRVGSCNEDPCDLVNVLPKHTIYVNLWRDKSSKVLQSISTICRAEWDREAKVSNGRGLYYDLVARFEHTVTEGEGLT